jgi:hypothetical protein
MPEGRRQDVRGVEDLARNVRQYQGRANQALEQTRDNVLRHGEVVGCELLNFFVLP